MSQTLRLKSDAAHRRKAAREARYERVYAFIRERDRMGLPPPRRKEIADALSLPESVVARAWQVLTLRGKLTRVGYAYTLIRKDRQPSTI